MDQAAWDIIIAHTRRRILQAAATAVPAALFTAAAVKSLADLELTTLAHEFAGLERQLEVVPEENEAEFRVIRDQQDAIIDRFCGQRAVGLDGLRAKADVIRPLVCGRGGTDLWEDTTDDVYRLAWSMIRDLDAMAPA